MCVKRERERERERERREEQEAVSVTKPHIKPPHQTQIRRAHCQIARQPAGCHPSPAQHSAEPSRDRHMPLAPQGDHGGCDRCRPSWPADARPRVSQPSSAIQLARPTRHARCQWPGGRLQGSRSPQPTTGLGAGNPGSNLGPAPNLGSKPAFVTASQLGFSLHRKKKKKKKEKKSNQKNREAGAMAPGTACVHAWRAGAALCRPPPAMGSAVFARWH